MNGVDDALWAAMASASGAIFMKFGRAPAMEISFMEWIPDKWRT